MRKCADMGATRTKSHRPPKRAEPAGREARHGRNAPQGRSFDLKGWWDNPRCRASGLLLPDLGFGPRAQPCNVLAVTPENQQGQGDAKNQGRAAAKHNGPDRRQRGRNQSRKR